MGKTHVPYSPEFQRQMIDLVRAGRPPEDLARAFEPSAQAIRNWVAQADRNEGQREDGVTSAEREELVRLRRENRQLRLERDIGTGGSLVRTGDRDDPVRVFHFISANPATAAARPEAGRPWARSAAPMITPWPRASSPRSNANSSIATASAPTPRPAEPSSPSSKAGTIRAGGILP
jgi:transposase